MRNSCILFFIVALISACGSKQNATQLSAPLTTIAFGSCGHQSDPQPVLAKVAAQHPDLFIFLGDNIYSDTHSMDTLRNNYKVLGEKPEFALLKKSTNILATWDDHDYGWNDSGRHYPFKEESKKIFLDFFGVFDPSIFTHEGIYYSKIFSEHNRKLQIIMPDMRTFRDDLLPYNGNRQGDNRFNYNMDYSPYETGDSTLLGEQQWQWLEKQFDEPADIRIIGSSTQFGITHNGYEAWANFPHEQKRMLDLIKRKKVEGVLFISGDVHYAEISRLSTAGLYPVYDVTSSGITSTWEFATPNDNRVDGPVMENNYGLITIDWSISDPSIAMEIYDARGEKRISRSVRLSELTF